MFSELYEYLNWMLGLDQEKINVGHMIARATIVYALGILLIILDKRFIGEHSPFDTILRFIIGSALANAICGNSPYFSTLGMAVFIVAVNRLLALISFYSKTGEKILKGPTEIIFKNNQIQWSAMRRNLLSRDDLLSGIRKNAGFEHLSQVKRVVYENSGEMSVIPRKLYYSSFVSSRARRKREDE